MNRADIQEAYIQRILDGMGIKELLMYAAEKLEQEYSQLSDEELLEDVRNYYPDILEES